MYGTAEIRKIDTRTIPLEFAFFEKIADPNFLTHFQNELESFINSLLAEQSPGKLPFTNVFLKHFKTDQFSMLRPLFYCQKCY
jgi:hypothetical protein